MNINYLSALGAPGKVEDTDLIARRFLASQAIMLALRGVPGIYFHSLFGSRNWSEGVEQTGRYRTINREKLQREKLEDELADPDSLRQHVFLGYRKLLKARTASAAFHPTGGQQVLSAHPYVFAVLRTSPDGAARVLCLQNVSDQSLQLSLSLDLLDLRDGNILFDILSELEYTSHGDTLDMTIAPYQVVWLQL